MTGQPSLEDLRRMRGEGWQWARTQTEPCPQCGLHPGAESPPSLGPRLVELAEAWREFLVSADDAYLRTNPEPGVFSPMQYAAHVRDILGAYGDRVILVMAEDEPTVPQLNPNSEEWEAYNRLDAEELADDLEAQAARLAELLAGLDDESWRRTFVRDGGQDGIVRYDLAGLASYAVHEAHHHLLDADGTLPVGGGST
ncbi:MAG: DinB family protein [Acidimicrobiales bacterium]